MRLPDDIRNLPHRRRLHRDRLLKTACYEAAHTIYAVRTGVDFLGVRIGSETVDSRTLHSDITRFGAVEAAGRFSPDPDFQYYRSDIYPTGHGWEDAAKLSLAGHVFEGIVDPHHSGFYLMLMGSMSDFQQAIETTKWGLYVEDQTTKDYGRLIDDTIEQELMPPVRKLLIENWTSIIRIGELLKERKMLTPAEVREAIA
jgi:hypothetical protein